jgi:signal peptide peptidase SppA
MRSTDLEHVSQAFYGHPWAIVPEKLAEMREVLRRRVGGELPAEVGKRLGKRPSSRVQAPTPGTEVRHVAGQPVRQYGKVAILPLYGPIAQRLTWLTHYCGGTSTELFGRAFDALVADKSVKTIVFDVDSPGGSVFGVQEVAQKVFDARGAKKVVAIANSLMASAAYWIAAQAQAVYVTPGGMAGSVGVVSVHEDLSGANDQAGRKVTYVTAGQYKAEGNPDTPLDAEALADWQRTVDAYYEAFIKAVACGRGVTEAKVRAHFGQGRVFTAAAAVAAGLCDKVMTLEQLLVKLGAEGAPGGPSAVALGKQRLAEAD